MNPAWMIGLFIAGMALVAGGISTFILRSGVVEGEPPSPRSLTLGLLLTIMGGALVVLAAAMYIAWLVRG